MLRFLNRSIKYIGIISILLFSAASIFFSFMERTLPQGHDLKGYIQYASFFENRFYDFRSNSTIEKHDKNEDIILIRVDDESLQTLGSWPINRNTWATMLDNLSTFGAKTVAFDVIFPEEVTSCGAISPDDTFANAIVNFQKTEGSKVILAYTAQDESVQADVYNEMPEDLYNFILDSQQADEQYSLVVKKVEKHTYPIEKLLAASPDLAFINMLEDTDGVFRHYQIVSNVDGEIFVPSMALRTVESYTTQNSKLVVDSSGSARLKFGQKDVFVNNRGETKIRWFGDSRNFDEISLHKVVDPKVDIEKMKEFFHNKIVFIGSTATGAHDLRNTPIDSKLPGVYAHINMVYMLINQFFYQELFDSIKISYILLAIGTLILLSIMLINNALIDITAMVSLVLSAYFIDQYLYVQDGHEIKLFFVIFNFVATYSWITFLNFNQANAEKKQIKGAFSRYVAPSIVDDMLDNPDKLKVGGERRDITCMFSDVRDFTSISEKLSATQLASALNRYMGEMTDIVFATNGTLDKYIGDAIVAFWGAPTDIGDHITQAVDAGVKMLEALPAINEEFKAKNLPEFKIGLGLNSGECNVGNMGSDQIFAYTALGDTMNLGARLESSCKFYGAQILISEYTYERMDRSKFTTRLIDKVRVKGKTKPVSVYEVLYNWHPLMDQPEALQTFKSSYKLFIEGNFPLAKEGFEKVLEVHSQDKSSIRLIESCQKWIETPPTEGEDHTITTRTDK